MELAGGQGLSLSMPTETGTHCLPFRTTAITRFKNRREAERALAEIVEDGGKPSDFRIDEHPDGSCVITILEHNGEVAGVLGA